MKIYFLLILAVFTKVNKLDKVLNLLKKAE